MQVEIVRRGGLPAVPVRDTVDTTELSPDEAAAAEAALRGLQFGRPAPQPPGPERFQYEIIVVSGATRRSVVLNEADLPDGLWPLVELAVARGKIG
jgi:hypothetical protein